MPPKNKTLPKRQARNKGSVEEVLVDVLEELKTLRNDVNKMKEDKTSGIPEHSVDNINTSSDSNAAPSGAVSAMAEESPSSSFKATTSGVLMQPVPSSSLPIVDIVPENLRRDIIRGKNINLVQLLIPARERGSFATAREITIGDDTLSLKPLADKRLTNH